MLTISWNVKTIISIKKILSKQHDTRVGVICNCNIQINSNLPFFSVIASNQLLCG